MQHFTENKHLFLWKARCVQLHLCINQFDILQISQEKQIINRYQLNKIYIVHRYMAADCCMTDL